jgi:uncharacterized membrane protein YbhN (UPF0104 family)
LLRVTRRQEIALADLSINHRAVLSGLSLYGVGYFISGASQYLLARSILPVAWDDFFFVVAAFNIAGAVGMASVVTPSGLGVREGVLLILLPVVMPREAALVVTAASRLWSIIVDLAFFAITQGQERIVRARRPDQELSLRYGSSGDDA